MSYRLGLLMQLTDQTRAGITWNSETDYSFNIDGNARLQNGTYDLPVSATDPARRSKSCSSLVHDINPRWSVMGDLGWQDWSQFGAPQIVVGGPAAEQRQPPEGHVARCGGRAVSSNASVATECRCGRRVDSSPYESQSDVALTLPTGDEWRFGTGAQYQITPASNIGIAVSYLHMQSSHGNRRWRLPEVTTILIFGLPASTTAISFDRLTA